MADPSLPSPLVLLAREVRSQIRLFWRNPLTALFTVVLPLLLLPLLDALNPTTRVRLPSAVAGRAGGGVGAFGFAPFVQYAAPAVAAFAVTAACFANLAIRTAVARESGVLKRVRGTPAPAWVDLGGRVLANITVSAAVVASTLVLGTLAYDTSLPARSIMPVLIVVLIGAFTFSALGLAATTIVPNADAAPAVVYAILFPLAFISSVFFPREAAPQWMETVASWLPLEPFVSSLVAATTPTSAGWGPAAEDLIAMGSWAAGGVIATLATFRWVPRSEASGGTTRLGTSARARLAVALAAAIVATGVFVWEGDESDADVDLAAAADLGPAPLNVVVNLEVEQAPPDFAIADREGGTPVPVTVVDRASGPVALLGSTCGLTSIADVDPAWLGAVAPDRSGGQLVDVCAGHVYDDSGRCTGGGCTTGLYSVPVTARDGRLVADMKVAVQSDEVVESEAPRPKNLLLFDSKVTVTNGDDVVRLAGLMALITDPGLSLIAADYRMVVTIETAGPLGGAIAGATVDGIRPGPTVFLSLTNPLPWLSVPPNTERVIGDATITRPDTATWLVTQRADPEAGVLGPVSNGRLEIHASGEIFDWEALTLHLSADTDTAPAEVVIELTRQT